MGAAAIDPQSLGLALRHRAAGRVICARAPRSAGQSAAHAQFALSYSVSPCRAWVPPPQAPPRSRAANAPYPGSRRRRRAHSALPGAVRFPTKMAAVGRVGSFGSCPPGLTATYTGGPLANELASGNGGAAAGDDEDGQNLW